MAATSNTLSLGTRLPAFSLTNVKDGRPVASSDLVRRPTLVMFICNHCPYVVHVRAELGRIGRDYIPKGVAIVAINSNSVRTHPMDGPEHMKALAESERWGFPFLFDATQLVAKVFRAACTPEFYLFDTEHKLVYHGQLDDSRPGNSIPVTGKDLRAAIDAVLKGQHVPHEQKASMGCSIKWDPEEDR